MKTENQQEKEKLEKFIERLRTDINLNYQSGEDPSDQSWGYQRGVLLSNREAEYVLSLLHKTK